MRKEVLYAILGGSVLGLIIAFGIWRANLAFKNSATPASTTSPSSTPSPEFGLTLAKPENESVSLKDTIDISGLTKPGTTIVISAEEKDYFPPVDDKGAFETNVDLVGGVNQILVTAFDTNGAASSQNLSIIYSSEFANNIKTPAPTPSPVPSATISTEESALNEKVQQKIGEALLNPKAYLGTVTDIVEQTIQIKTDTGEIKQVSVASDASIVKVDDTNKTIKFTDIAIGDYAIAMGFINSNNVLDSQRVLITSAPGPVSRKILWGTINKISSYSLTLTTKGNEVDTFSLTYNTDIWQEKDGKLVPINTTNLKEQNHLIMTGITSGKTFEARSILLVP